MTKKPEAGPVYRVHTSCDVEKYSQRPFGDQHFVQEQLERINRRSATRAHVDRENAVVLKAGDGDLTRWPAEVTAAGLLADFVPALHRELVECNRRLSAEGGIRMRFAVTAGTSEWNEYGLAGPAPIIAARLVDSALVRAELANAPEYPLVVVVDDAVFQDAVGSGVHYLDRKLYREGLITDEKKEFTRRVWLTVPGRPVGDDEEAASRRRFVDPGVAAGGDTGETSPAAELCSGPEAERSTDEPRGWRTWSTAVKAAVITATGAVVAALITAAVALANGPNTLAGPTSTSRSAGSTTSSTGVPSPSATAGTLIEIAANHRGSSTFTDPGGAASNAGSIPFGTHVAVSCQAPNLSGMSSINAFYKVETEPWKGLYAPANTFANGDVLGSNGTHDIDTAVPQCPVS